MQKDVWQSTPFLVFTFPHRSYYGKENSQRFYSFVFTGFLCSVEKVVGSLHGTIGLRRHRMYNLWRKINGARQQRLRMIELDIVAPYPSGGSTSSSFGDVAGVDWPTSQDNPRHSADYQMVGISEFSCLHVLFVGGVELAWSVQAFIHNISKRIRSLGQAEEAGLQYQGFSILKRYKRIFTVMSHTPKYTRETWRQDQLSLDHRLHIRGSP